MAHQRRKRTPGRSRKLSPLLLNVAKHARTNVYHEPVHGYGEDEAEAALFRESFTHQNFSTTSSHQHLHSMTMESQIKNSARKRTQGLSTSNIVSRWTHPSISAFK